MNDRRNECPDSCPRKSECLHNPCIKGVGNKSSKIMLVSENPDRMEDEDGLSLSGEAGRLLNTIFAQLNVSREDFFITDAVKCGTNNEDPKPSSKEIKFCRHFLEDEIKEVKPVVIGVLGATALKSVLNRTGITKLKNNVFFSEEFNCKIVPVYHPRYILRNPNEFYSLSDGIKLILEEAKSTEINTAALQDCKHLVADTTEKIDEILFILEKKDKFVCDLETQDLNYLTTEILCVSVSWKEKFGVVIPWKSFSALQLARFVSILQTKKLKINHNIKFDMQVLKAHKICVKGPIFDTMLAHHLIDENTKHGLDDLTLRYLDLGEYWADLEKEKAKICKERKIAKEEFKYDMLPDKVLHPYAATDADATYRLYNILSKELDRQNLTKFFNDHTMTFMPVLLYMEFKGIKIDREKLSRLIEECKKQIVDVETILMAYEDVKKYEDNRKALAVKKLEDKYNESKILKSRYPNGVEEYAQKILKEEDWKFNFHSPKQLQELLFKQMGLKASKETKTGFSTDEESMIELAEHHNVEFAKKLVEYRKLTKYCSTYLEAVFAKSAHDGRIHTTYQQHLTVSGRLCVGKDTILETNQGKFRISELKLNKLRNVMILSHMGRQCRILNKFYKGREQLYRVVLDNGDNIECTLGHRFLTLEGWKHVSQLKVGSVICNRCINETPALESGTLGFNQGVLCGQGGQRGNVTNRPYEDIQVFKNNIGQQFRSVRGRISGGIKEESKQKSCKSNDLQHTWSTSSKDTHRLQVIRGVDRKAYPGRTNCTNVKYDTVVCSSPSKEIRIKKKNGILYGINRRVLFEFIGQNTSGVKRTGIKLQRRSRIIFSRAVSGVYRSSSDSMVRKESSKAASGYDRFRENKEKSYLLEQQSARITSIIGITRKGDHAYQTISAIKNQELSSRFLFSNYKVISRGGWQFSSERQKNARTRCYKTRTIREFGVSSSSFYRDSNSQRSFRSPVNYSTGIIVAIEPTTIDEVWDIEVEGDHSYCAHGFINHNSSRNPNLQNISRDAKDFKSCFISDPGYVFVKSDLSQAEFRCWAHYSGDQDMITDIEAGMDIHKLIASEVFNVPIEQIDKKDPRRTAAKNAVFGLMYGRGSQAISMQYNITLEQAEEIKERFFGRYPVAAAWLKSTIREARETGCVRTWFGRVRRLPKIHSDNMGDRAEAERQATNSPIQGQASDMNNGYLIRILREAKARGIDCYPAATIHDDNTLQVKEEQAEQLIAVMKHVVATAFPDFKCRMELEFKKGNNLGYMEDAK